MRTTVTIALLVGSVMHPDDSFNSTKVVTDSHVPVTAVELITALQRKRSISVLAHPVKPRTAVRASIKAKPINPTPTFRR